jgi:D-glycero-D-manno-heptose 1,7-bisphosphate phosphatase
MSMSRPQRQAVFLDRDGVLNETIVRDGKPYPPETVAEVRIPAGALAALLRLKEHHFVLPVVTNQPDVARGTQTIETVEEIDDHLKSQLPVDDFFVCYHDDADNCSCRKPRPGLVLRAAEHYGIDLSRSFLIGDRWRDIEAGASAGCRTIWIDRGYAEKSPSPDARVQSLTEAVDWILNQ